MSRIWVCAVALAVAIGGCGGGEAGDTVTTVTASSPPPTTATTAATTPPDGEMLATSLCTNCHSTNGDSRVTGPTLLGLAGSTVPLVDGSMVVADTEYILNSIIDSQSQLREGDWTGPMPEWYPDQLSPEQIAALVAYVESLR